LGVGSWQLAVGSWEGVGSWEFRRLDTIDAVRVETLFLDAGGVLVFPNWQRVSDTFARHGIAVSAAALHEAEPQARFAIDEPHRVATTSDADRGSQYFRLVLEKAGVPADASIQPALEELWTYHTEHNLWEYVPPDVFPALERLAALGVTMAVASNANGALERMFHRVGLTRYFHAICDSCVEGAEKPDPKFFNIVLQRAGGRPETTVHVGDLYHVDAVGARQAGLHAVLMDPHDLYAAYDVDRVANLAALVDYVRERR
jgi:putative hydrolase of the HAD superfamily